MIGARLGRLTVICEAFKKGDEWFWRCLCDCGKTMEARRRHIASGAIQSCGCYHAERIRATHTRHGGAGTTTYRIWSGMRQRCHNPRNPNYELYGARGISVCDRWRYDFAAFLTDMGARPSPLLSLDRINNDGNYEPGNCRWATVAQQMANRRPYRVQEQIVKDDKRFERWLARKGGRLTPAQHENAERLLFSMNCVRLNARNKAAMPLVMKHLVKDRDAFQESMQAH